MDIIFHLGLTLVDRVEDELARIGQFMVIYVLMGTLLHDADGLLIIRCNY